MSSTIEIAVNRAPWLAGVEFLITDESSTFGYGVAENLTFHEINEEFAEIKPTGVLSYAAAQKLMDSLWDAGLRPSEGSGSAGALKAVENHLADMRKIAFNRLKIIK